MTTTTNRTPGSTDGTGQEPSEAPAAVVARLRASFAAGTTRPLAWRRAQLQGLLRLFAEGEAELVEALRTDLGRPATEAYVGEIAISVAEVKHLLRHLQAWTAPKKVSVPLALQPGKATVHREPLGVALVIAPWNYPAQLLLLPMAAAIAAGNAVLGKPSELAPATSAVLARLVPRYLDPAGVAIVEGAVEETTALLAERFDHIFYTGNGRVGRIVARAAAEHLTPVTLELGGKSPAIVAADADLTVAARRIAFGKFFNAGQTCVAPDHVLVERSVRARFVDELVGAVTGFYGADPQASPDYGRIVNDAHFGRLVGLLDGGGYERVATGGGHDAATRYLAPTVLDGATDEAPVMGEEVFGPLLPVLEVDDVDAAVAHVNAGDAPLALYAFTGSSGLAESIRERTSSGGMAVNNTLLQLDVPDLPFGGVGPSGYGAYHGQAGVDTFSHRRSVFAKPAKPDLPVMYPPYRGWKDAILRRVL